MDAAQDVSARQLTQTLDPFNHAPEAVSVQVLSLRTGMSFIDRGLIVLEGAVEELTTCSSTLA